LIFKAIISMRTYLECIPCFVRQALEAARHATDDDTVHERVMRGVLAEASRMDFEASPPVMGRFIHRTVRRLTGRDDPYADVKASVNQMALELYPGLRERVAHADDPFAMALRLAVAGNIIDFGVHSRVDRCQVKAAIEQALDADDLGPGETALVQALRQAQRILYIADNAGEIVFDRLLVEQMPREKITLAVRGAPVLNDATRKDAAVAGLNDRVAVIDSGSDAPGIILEDCSRDFRSHFARADLIIAKGQGNYETLSGLSAPLCFILRAKCPVIASHIGCAVGTPLVLCRL
jgi:uncharacterized protein with ATP-grasp and redox domains